MTIAIFGQAFDATFSPYMHQLVSLLKDRNLKVFFYRPFYDRIMPDKYVESGILEGFFDSVDDLPETVSYFFSIGGDGTFLKSILILKGRPIPIVGINFGRLGFLSAVFIDDMEKAIDMILNNEYKTEERSLLRFDCNPNVFKDFNYALNEITITKRDSSSMISIHTYINGEYLTTYWADGLIISTPTGSTAYSLSVGGPILTPDSENVIITPIAPHNLTMRPIVIPDHNVITLKVEGRGKQFLASLDTYAQSIDFPGEIEIRKAEFNVRTVKIKGHSFFNSLRTRLMWGADKRNT